MTAQTTKRPTKAKAKPDSLPADLSPIVTALEKAYRMIQKRFPDTPDATIVVKRDERAWGHTTVAKTWSHHSHEGSADRFEIMISGENLRRGAEAVAGTLLHEAAHARNLGHGILDTDVNGRHNKAFAITAETHGLTVRMAGWRGYTDTSLSEQGTKDWAVMLRMLRLAIAKAAAAAAPSMDHLGVVTPKPAEPPVAGVHGPVGLTPPRRRGNRNLLVAVCNCGCKVRLSKGVLDRCKPKCQECDSEFTLAD